MTDITKELVAFRDALQRSGLKSSAEVLDRTVAEIFRLRSAWRVCIHGDVDKVSVTEPTTESGTGL